MFENIGGKIKGLAVVVCWVGIVTSVISAIVLWCVNSYRNPTIGLGISVLIGGVLGSWIGSFFTYGFGEMIENSEKSVRNQERILAKLESLQEEMNEREIFKADERSADPVRVEQAEKLVKVEPVAQEPTIMRRNRVAQAEMWMCNECGAYVFRTHSTCPQCGKAR